MEDVADTASQFAIAKALASGDQRLMQKAGLEAELARMEPLRAAHFDNQHAIRRQITMARGTSARAAIRIGGESYDLGIWIERTGMEQPVRLDGDLTALGLISRLEYALDHFEVELNTLDRRSAMTGRVQRLQGGA